MHTCTHALPAIGECITKTQLIKYYDFWRKCWHKVMDLHHPHTSTNGFPASPHGLKHSTQLVPKDSKGDIDTNVQMHFLKWSFSDFLHKVPVCYSSLPNTTDSVQHLKGKKKPFPKTLRRCSAPTCVRKPMVLSGFAECNYTPLPLLCLQRLHLCTFIVGTLVAGLVPQFVWRIHLQTFFLHINLLWGRQTFRSWILFYVAVYSFHFSTLDDACTIIRSHVWWPCMWCECACAYVHGCVHACVCVCMQCVCVCVCSVHVCSS